MFSKLYDKKHTSLLKYVSTITRSKHFWSKVI